MSARLRSVNFRVWSFCLALSVVLLHAAHAQNKPANPDPVVDSGSFSILVNGKHVATETFRMEQHSSSNTVTSQLKYDDSSIKASQRAEMEINSSGMLKKYTWTEIEPVKAEIVVEPQDENFIVSHIAASGGAPARDNVHPLPPSVTILDDNFFSQLQVLAWKYLAVSCPPDKEGKTVCNFQEQKIPVLNPHQQSSQVILLSFEGRHAMKWKNSFLSFNVFKIKAEAGESELWVGDDHKLVRVRIAADNTEVLRD